ncbi:RagB/SusD family nutrient uptake outer membrane protein [Chitinophaga sp. RAB17]|uniref:RagB/SusD family nutrient uptake outer membrane protein n=1 Tax=Chitinophaga sp. RAB17 TaxID=3233049 RepID=UPI003F8D9F8D
MKQKYFFILLIPFLTLGSCKKDILNSPPLTAVSDATVWNDINLVQNFINEKYKILPHFYLYTSLPSHMGYSAASDECYSMFNYESVNRLNSGALTPDNMALDSWTVDYNYIRDINLFFSKIDVVPGDEALKNRLKGEATFIRAYCYFDLATKYGGIPLITKVYTAADKGFNETRSTYEEAVKFVTTELDKAATLLPLNYEDAMAGRITKGASLALKSRMLLYAASPLWNTNNDASKWQAAANAAKAVIDLNQYSLWQNANYHDLFITPDHSEIILSAHQNDIKYQLYIDIHLSPNGYHGWSAYTPTQHIVDQFEMANGKMINETGSGYDAQKPYENRDPRLYADIIYNGAKFKTRPAEYFRGGMDSPQSPVENWNASKTGYNWRKYNNEAYDLNTQAVGSKTPFIIFRLSEIYLNFAEALNALGKDDSARTYVNMVRTRTGVNMPALDASITGLQLRDKIRHEREVELCLEGNRFFDVRRWKIAETTDNLPARGVKVTKNTDGSFTYDYNYTVEPRKFFAPQHYLFPIPKYELDKVSLPQNPGYN